VTQSAAGYTQTALEPSGRILVGGEFLFVNGTPRRGLFRLLPSGALDLSFAPVLDGAVYCIRSGADGSILIGGAFTTVNGTTRNRLARLNGDGTLDTKFDFSFDGAVFAIAEQADGKTIISGNYPYLVRLDANGTRDASFCSAADRGREQHCDTARW
jgi:hypothetical protein